MANRIIIGDTSAPLLTFNDADIEGLTEESAVSLTGGELTVDVLEPELKYDIHLDYDLRTSDGFRLVSSDGLVIRPLRNYDLRHLPYGTKITLETDNIVSGEFYSQKVKRNSRNKWSLKAESAVGMMSKQPSPGGIYTGQSFETVLRETIGEDYKYQITEDAAKLQIYGWLPYSTRRENLHQLLMATGVNLIRADDGTMLFTILGDSSPGEVSEARIYAEGDVDYGEAPSRIEVTEHSYYFLDTALEQVVFDNTKNEAVENALVKFAQPFYPDSLYCSEGSLQIVERGVNFARVSGVGILAGKPYTHTTRVVEANNTSGSAENVKRVDKATLVTVANSENVLLRLSEYFFNATVVNGSLVHRGEKCGRRYRLLNPFGEQFTGFMARMSVQGSATTKAECEFIQNYTPRGLGNTYGSMVVLSGSSGVWQIPDSVFNKEQPLVRLVLIGKGENGSPGSDGGAGESPTENAGGKGGEGGLPGNAGAGGKVYVATINVAGLDALYYFCNDETTVLYGESQLSSADGASLETGYLDVFTGTVYALPGQPGQAGAAGGKGGVYKPTGTDAERNFPTDGESLTFKGITYSGGKASGRELIPIRIEANTAYVGGAGGGGAAPGADGGTPKKNTDFTWSGFIDGGDGADARAADPAAGSFGSGGNGGHGGGGAGGGGLTANHNWLYGPIVGYVYGKPGNPGKGGEGSEGQAGCLIAYF